MQSDTTGFFFFPFLRAKYVRTLKGEINEHWCTANIKKTHRKRKISCCVNYIKHELDISIDQEVSFLFLFHHKALKKKFWKIYAHVTEEGTKMLHHGLLIANQNMAFLFAFCLVCVCSELFHKLIHNASPLLPIEKS